MWEETQVHIPDGAVSGEICVAAALLAGGATFASIRGLRDAQVPRFAVLTATFFVVGAIHIRLGPGSVHLLCTGLLAVVLGWRSMVAVSLGVCMHAMLLQHGGLTTIGVNALVLGTPALVVGWVIDCWRNKVPASRYWMVGALATVAVYTLTILLFFALVSFAGENC